MPKMNRYMWMEEAWKLNKTVRKEVELWWSYSNESKKFEDYVKQSKINYQEVSIEDAVQRYYEENDFFTNYSFLPTNLVENFDNIIGRGLDVDIKYRYKKEIQFIPFYIGWNWTNTELEKLLQKSLEYYKTDALELAIRFGNSTEELYKKWLVEYFEETIVRHTEITRAFKKRAEFLDAYIEQIAINKTHRSPL